jgi:hypothetical protein
LHGLRAARDPLDNELREVSRTDKETGKNDQPGGKDHGKRPDSGQPAKTARLDIHEERTLAVDDGPEGSRFIGHRAFTVQDLRIGPHNTRFLLERVGDPRRPSTDGRLPAGSGWTAFRSGPACLHSVPAPPLPRHAAEAARATARMGPRPLRRRRSTRLLASGQDAFSAEKSSLLKAGLAVSSAITVDDSGARHQGQNGYVTVVSGPTFAWFGSADNKSRVGFLTHLHDGQPSYVLNDIALCHLQKQGLKAVLAERLQTNLFAGDDWAAYLDHVDIRDDRHRRIATEAGLLGGLVAKGIHPMLAIVSDGAGQFDILEHGLCWVHTERLVHKLIPSNTAQRGEKERMRGEIWAYYADLKAYRAAPAPEEAEALTARFKTLFAQRTGWATLDRLLRRIRQHRCTCSGC